MAGKRTRRSAFVPRLIVKTAIVGVIPACAVGCGSSDTPAPVADAATDSLPFGVAAVAFPAYDAGAPPEAGPVDASGGLPDVFLGVAAVAYPAYEAGAPDVGTKDAQPDAFHGFVLAVTAFEVEGPRKG
jgi:hypothetical protein